MEFETFLQTWERAQHKTATYREYLTLLTLWRMKRNELEAVRDLIERKLADK